MENTLIQREIEDLLTRFTNGNVLHAKQADGDTVVALVFEVGRVRYYRAMEYTQDGAELTQAYGYETTDRACYMGQRYDIPGLWGAYRDEIFTHTPDVHNPINEIPVCTWHSPLSH